jgi:hypothetical protein
MMTMVLRYPQKSQGSMKRSPLGMNSKESRPKKKMNNNLIQRLQLKGASRSGSLEHQIPTSLGYHLGLVVLQQACHSMKQRKGSNSRW